MMERRAFLRLGLGGAAAVLAVGSPWLAAIANASAVAGESPYGPLLDPDENGIRLPRGFRSRLLARSLEPVPGTQYEWHVFPDGGAVFPTLSGWIYVSNSEVPGIGGVGAMRFNRSGDVIDAYRLLDETVQNCAGGKTPWQTWLSCEEYSGGYVFECDPFGRRPSVVRPAMGRFQHEAVAVDRTERRFYLTEDVGDGGFYRFTPTNWTDLSSGTLEIASVDARGRVSWLVVPDPDPRIQDGATATRHQLDDSTPFKGGEGIVVHRRTVFFTTKGDNRVWAYDLRRHTMEVVYDLELDPGRQLSGVDNIDASRDGDLIVAEDGGNMELVVITPSGRAAPLLRVVNQDDSELAGQAFSPDGRRMYFSSQRAGGVGATYEVTGPFLRRHRRTARPRRLARRLP